MMTDRFQQAPVQRRTRGTQAAPDIVDFLGGPVDKGLATFMTPADIADYHVVTFPVMVYKGPGTYDQVDDIHDLRRWGGNLGD